MRAIWSGEIAFGLVSIPVKLYAATKDLSPRFHYVHKKCGTQLQTVRRCPHCHVDVDWKDVSKGFEVSKGRFAVFTGKELGEIGEENAAEGVDLVQCIDDGELDPVYVDKSYWVAPGGKSTRGYALLRDALESTGRVALARVKIRSRTRLAALRPRDGRFSLDIIRFADEIVACKDVEVAASSKKATPRELQLAKHLVDQMTDKFTPSKLPDEYRKAVMAAVEAKVEADDVTETGDADRDVASKGRRSEKVVDLADMLARSLDAGTRRKNARPAVAAKHASTKHEAPARRKTTRAAVAAKRASTSAPARGAKKTRAKK